MVPVLVSVDKIDYVFPKIAKHLERAIRKRKNSTWTLGSLHTACANRSVYLFVDDIDNPRNALVAQAMVMTDPTFYIHIVAGEGGFDWKKTLPYFNEFKNKLGITRQIVFNGRLALMKAFKVKVLSYTCEIDEG